MGNNNAAIYDESLYLQAGINPAAVIPQRRLKNGSDGVDLIIGLKKNLEIQDRQDALTRYKWLNLPKGLTGKLIEQVLYLKGQGAFCRVGDKFMFLPYTLASENSNGIDCYGRYKSLTFVAMGSTNDNKRERKIFGNQIFDILYECAEKMEKKESRSIYSQYAITLRDYTEKFMGEMITPRWILNDCLIDLEAQVLLFARTASLSKTGVKAFKLESGDQVNDVESMNSTVYYNAIGCKLYTGVVGNIETQELSANNSAGDVSEFLTLAQAFKNMRKGLYGLKNGGLMLKQSHMLNSEMQRNNGEDKSALDDGLYNRQMACVLFYSVFGHPMWCVVNETQEEDDNEQGQETSMMHEGGSESESNNN